MIGKQNKGKIEQDKEKKRKASDPQIIRDFDKNRSKVKIIDRGNEEPVGDRK